MLLLNINRKAFLGSLILCLHFTLVTLKDQCQGHSYFEGLMFLNISLQKIAICHTNCRCQAERQGPWTSCFGFVSFLCSFIINF